MNLTRYLLTNTSRSITKQKNVLFKRTFSTTGLVGKKDVLLKNTSTPFLFHRMFSSTALDRRDSFTGLDLTANRAKGGRSAQEAVNNILYNGPAITEKNTRHILSILVDNEPGVLSKISGLLSARGFNIDSLSVSKTDVKELSRMTIVLDGPNTVIEQAGRQLEDLCDVWAVMDYKNKSVLERELAILKVNCAPPAEGDEHLKNWKPKKLNINGVATPMSYSDIMNIHLFKQAVLETAKMFDAKVIDVGSETLVFEIVSWSKRVDAFIRMMGQFGIVEAVRSGTIAMNRSAVAGVGMEDDERSGASVDLSDLPPS